MPCENCDKYVGTLYCTTCKSTLCMVCSEVTHNSRLLARHRRVPVAEKPEEPLLCSQHPKHVLELVCLDFQCQQPTDTEPQVRFF